MSTGEIVGLAIVSYFATATLTLVATTRNWQYERGRYLGSQFNGGNPDRAPVSRAARAVIASPFWPALLVYFLAICAAGAWTETRTGIRKLWNDAFPPKKENR